MLPAYEPALLASAPVLGVFGCILAALLLGLAYSDLQYMLLPDNLNALLALGGLTQSIALDFPQPLDAGLGALAGSGLLAIVAAGFYKLRGYEGLGMGDIKFGAAAGLWIGWQGLPFMLFVASLSALIFVVIRAIRQRKLDVRSQLPFGPFLCAGTLLTWVSTVTA